MVHYLKRDQDLIVNHQKLYRLCKENDLLLPRKKKKKSSGRSCVKIEKSQALFSFGSLISSMASFQEKTDFLQTHVFESFSQAYVETIKFIKFYNERRIHGSIDNQSPKDFLRRWTNEAKNEKQ